MSNSSSSGIGFLGLLTIAFIVLKLTNVIEWSWWLVLLPVYGMFLMFPAVIVLVLTINLVIEGLKKLK